MNARDVRLSALALVENGRLEPALELLERAVERVARYADWAELVEVPRALPAGLLLEDPRWARAYSAALVGLREERPLLEFSGTFCARHPLPDSAPVLSDRAWALLNQDRYAEAQAALEAAIPHLGGWRRGVALQRLAQARFELGGDWRAALAEAYPLLAGRLKGLALNEEGHLWSRLHDHARAREKWLEALVLLESDPFHLAWVHHSLGQSYLRDLSPEAERHLRRAEQLTRSRAARAFRARALQGWGNYLRSRGEWARAEAAYREAIRCAREAEDLRVAYWSLGRCYRLQGRPAEALEVLQHALALFPPERAPVQVERAAALLALGQEEAARAALEAAAFVFPHQLWLASVLYAELARRAGDGSAALQLIAELPVEHFQVREEAGCWGELFAMARLAGQPAPRPLEYLAHAVVRVQALGTLKVWVNAQAVPIKPTGRVGELLVLLLEHGPRTAAEKLVELLWPGSTPRDKRQALWQLVDELRRALGWPGSVRAAGGCLELDPQARWEYDVGEARACGRAHAPFLEGVYSEWAQEVAQEVEELRRRGERRPDLN